MGLLHVMNSASLQMYGFASPVRMSKIDVKYTSETNYITSLLIFLEQRTRILSHSSSAACSVPRISALRSSTLLGKKLFLFSELIFISRSPLAIHLPHQTVIELLFCTLMLMDNHHVKTFNVRIFSSNEEGVILTLIEERTLYPAKRRGCFLDLVRDKYSSSLPSW